MRVTRLSAHPEIVVRGYGKRRVVPFTRSTARASHHGGKWHAKGFSRMSARRRAVSSVGRGAPMRSSRRGHDAFDLGARPEAQQADRSGWASRYAHTCGPGARQTPRRRPTEFAADRGARARARPSVQGEGGQRARAALCAAAERRERSRMAASVEGARHQVDDEELEIAHGLPRAADQTASLTRRRPVPDRP